MIDLGDYFVINRPRQYGKTTTLDTLNEQLRTSPEYYPMQISFEGIGSEVLENATDFIWQLIRYFRRETG